MYSEALAIADRNTVRLMIDEMNNQVNNLTNEIAEKENALKKKDNALKEKDNALKEKDSENNRLRQKLIAAGINPDE